MLLCSLLRTCTHCPCQQKRLRLIRAKNTTKTRCRASRLAVQCDSNSPGLMSSLTTLSDVEVEPSCFWLISLSLSRSCALSSFPRSLVPSLSHYLTNSLPPSIPHHLVLPLSLSLLLYLHSPLSLRARLCVFVPVAISL